MDSQIQDENFIKSKIKEYEDKIVRFYNLCEKLEKIIKEYITYDNFDIKCFIYSLFYLRTKQCNLLKIFEIEKNIEDIISEHKTILKDLNKNLLLTNISIFSRIIQKKNMLTYQQKKNWLNLFTKCIDVLYCEYIKTIKEILNPIILDENIISIINKFEDIIPYTDEKPSSYWINIFNDAKDKYNINLILTCLNGIEEKNDDTLLKDTLYVVNQFSSKIINNKNKEYILREIVKISNIVFNKEKFNLDDNITKKNSLISILEKHSVNPLNLEW